MRKILSLLALALALALLAGCAGRPASQPAVPAPTTPATSTTSAAQPAATPTPRPTRTPTPSATPSPTPTPWPTRPPRPTATPWLLPSATPTPAAPTPTPARAATKPPSPVGRLALQTAPGGPIYVIGADGQGLRQVTVGFDPAWSPDGTRLAVARLDGEQRGLYSVALDGGGETLLFGWSQLRWPAWTADGKTVVFSRQAGGKEARTICIPPYGCFTLPGTAYWRLGAVDVAERAFRDVPSDLLARSPAPRADGVIFYVGEQGVQATTLTENTNQLLRAERRAALPALSPDGSRLVYMSYLHDHYDLFVMNADGSGRAQLTRTSALAPRPAQNVAPAWSPDGRSIAFLSDRDGAWRLYIMDADGGNQRPFLAEALAGVSFSYAFADERAIAWSGR